MVMHLTVNQEDVGSTPTLPATYRRAGMKFFARLKDLRTYLVLYLAFLLLAIGSCVEHRLAHADDPMNKPLDSLGVFDYDRSLCNDRWNTCGDYERTSFGFKYPGRSLSELGLYKEAESWADPIPAFADDDLVITAEDPYWFRRLHTNEDWATKKYREIFPRD